MGAPTPLNVPPQSAQRFSSASSSVSLGEARETGRVSGREDGVGPLAVDGSGAARGENPAAGEKSSASGARPAVAETKKSSDEGERPTAVGKKQAEAGPARPPSASKQHDSIVERAEENPGNESPKQQMVEAKEAENGSAEAGAQRAGRPNVSTRASEAPSAPPLPRKKNPRADDLEAEILALDATPHLFVAAGPAAPHAGPMGTWGKAAPLSKALPFVRPCGHPAPPDGGKTAGRSTPPGPLAAAKTPPPPPPRAETERPWFADAYSEQSKAAPSGHVPRIFVGNLVTRGWHATRGQGLAGDHVDIDLLVGYFGRFGAIDFARTDVCESCGALGYVCRPVLSSNQVMFIPLKLQAISGMVWAKKYQSLGWV